MLQLGEIILTIIQAHYKGGIKQFQEDGGGLTYAPPPFNEFIILHPNIDPDLKRMMENIASQSGTDIIFVDTGNTINEETPQIMFEALKEVQLLADIALSTPVILINLFNLRKRDKRFIDFKKKLQEIPGIKRVYINISNEPLKISPKNENSLKSSTNTKAETVRDMVIGEDDITNLKIDLGSINTIEELLERM